MRLRVATGLAVLIASVWVGAAGAHVERSSYWPLPGADCSIHPCAGGQVPNARSLASALARTPGSTTRVVCQPGSLKLLSASIRQARRSGYYVRPADHRSLGGRAAARLLSLNRRLFARCRYREIQPAVTASQNNDRVVIMPGLYTEPTSAGRSDLRSELCQLPDKERPRHGGRVLRLSVPLPQRPEPDRGAGPRRGPRDRSPARPGGSPRDPQPRARASAATSRSRARASSADDVVIDAGRVASGNARPAER